MGQTNVSIESRPRLTVICKKDTPREASHFPIRGVGATFTDMLRPSGFFVFRSSLFPWGTFREWSSKKTKEELRDGLCAWLAEPAVREAIFLALPSLEESLPEWER